MGRWRLGGRCAGKVAVFVAAVSVGALTPALSAGAVRLPAQIAAITPQGAKLTGTGESAPGDFGWSVALSSDGNTALIGGSEDKGDGTATGDGAAWAFTRTGTAWSQDGAIGFRRAAARVLVARPVIRAGDITIEAQWTSDRAHRAQGRVLKPSYEVVR
jgi:hypothetical protein